MSQIVCCHCGVPIERQLSRPDRWWHTPDREGAGSYNLCIDADDDWWPAEPANSESLDDDPMMIAWQRGAEIARKGDSLTQFMCLPSARRAAQLTVTEAFALAELGGDRWAVWLRKGYEDAQT